MSADRNWPITKTMSDMAAEQLLRSALPAGKLKDI
jgi:hypothetical protein